jgi:DNA-directed RNA polymerase subunit RPC12/RpoP
MGAVETILDTVTDNRTYYDCPRCGQEVWAYGSFVGNVCWECPGTLAHGIVKTTDLATFGATSTVLDAVIDNRTEYRCPRCGVKKWAYGVGIGRPCLDCIGHDPLDFGLSKSGKDWYDMSKAADAQVSLTTFLDNDYYSTSSGGGGNVITINGQTFRNVIPKYKLQKAKYYTEVDTNWCCGNNAINMCLKMHGYSKQLSSNQYSYNTSMKCGWSYSNFYQRNLKNTFDAKYCRWQGTETMAREPAMKWGFIDKTDFTRNSLIIMGGRGSCAHYTIVLGISEDNKHYLVTDQSLKIWLVDVSLFRKISVYHLTQGMGVNLYKQHSVYRVGKK